jgi:hypothetical protein
VSVVTWVDLTTARNVTGTPAITQAQLDQAQGIVDLFSNRTPAASAGVRPRDVSRLGQAVAWQAAWLVAHPDVAQRSDVTAYGGDGVSVTLASPDSQVLAPLARRALRRLTWKRPGTIPVESPMASAYTAVERGPVDRDDQDHLWAPL